MSGLSKALEYFPGESELLAAKAVVYCKLGQIKQAIAISDMAMEQKAPTAYVWRRAVRCSYPNEDTMRNLL